MSDNQALVDEFVQVWSPQPFHSTDQHTLTLTSSCTDQFTDDWHIFLERKRRYFAQRHSLDVIQVRSAAPTDQAVEGIPAS